jgi:hypothetical protein
MAAMADAYEVNVASQRPTLGVKALVRAILLRCTAPVLGFYGALRATTGDVPGLASKSN